MQGLTPQSLEGPTLAPCPFCGKESAFGTVKYAPDSDTAKLNGQSLFHFVSCVWCGAKNKGLVGHSTKKDAAEAWNLRVSPAPIIPEKIAEAVGVINATLLDECVSALTMREFQALETVIEPIPSLLATLDTLRAQQTWMPISSAPKDGFHIQLYRDEIQFVGYYGGVNFGWILNAPGLPKIHPEATHWRPLPPSPGKLG